MNVSHDTDILLDKRGDEASHSKQLGERIPGLKNRSGN